MFLLAIILVMAAVAALVVGLVTSSPAVFFAAAAASALAVVILWRHLSVGPQRVVVASPPPRLVPDWDRPIDERGHDSGADERALPPVAIDGYEDLVAAEILPSLETLSIEQLQAVIARERHGLHRQGIIARAERLIDLTRGDVDLREEPVTAPTTPSTKAAGKTAPKRSRAKEPATQSQAESDQKAAAAKKTARSRKAPDKRPDLSL